MERFYTSPTLHRNWIASDMQFTYDVKTAIRNCSLFLNKYVTLNIWYAIKKWPHYSTTLICSLVVLILIFLSLESECIDLQDSVLLLPVKWATFPLRDEEISCRFNHNTAMECFSLEIQRSLHKTRMESTRVYTACTNIRRNSKKHCGLYCLIKYGTGQFILFFRGHIISFSLITNLQAHGVALFVCKGLKFASDQVPRGRVGAGLHPANTSVGNVQRASNTLHAGCLERAVKCVGHILQWDTSARETKPPNHCRPRVSPWKRQVLETAGTFVFEASSPRETKRTKMVSKGYEVDIVAVKPEDR